MDHNKQIAAGFTFLFGVVLIVVLILTRMGWSLPASDLPDPYIEMAVIEQEEFIEPELLPVPLTPGSEMSAPALTKENMDNDAKPAPETGTDLASQGAAGDPAKTVTTQKPSPVEKKADPQPEKPGNPSKAKEDAEKAKAAQTQQNVKNMFAQAQNKNNANNKKDDNGKAGKTTGNPDSAGPANSKSTKPGIASGRVGGGWQMPEYSNRIASNEVGNVTFEVEVNADGSVGKITRTDGSGLSDATVQACINEIRSKRFTPKNSNTEPATARITFKFQDPKK